MEASLTSSMEKCFKQNIVHLVKPLFRKTLFEPSPSTERFPAHPCPLDTMKLESPQMPYLLVLAFLKTNDYENVSMHPAV